MSVGDVGNYRVIAHFNELINAGRAAKALRDFFLVHAEEYDRALKAGGGPPASPMPSALAFASQLGFEWVPDAPHIWVDPDGFVLHVEVGLVGATVGVEHLYCHGLSTNISRALAAAGAAVIEAAEGAPVITARFVLPPGDAGERMAEELESFFEQGDVHDDVFDFETQPPWSSADDAGPQLGDSSSIFWEWDGDEHFGFTMELPLDRLMNLERYLSERGATELDLRLCDWAEVARFEARDTFEAIDAELEDVPDRDHLDISGKHLRLIPPRTFEFPLRALRVGDNPLRKLPPELFRASRLELLDLTKCALDAIPGELANLKNLHTLHLANNPLRAIPEALLALPELEHLDLNQSLGHITRLPALRTLPKLRTLLLSGGPRGDGTLAPHSVLDEVWEISTLETLAIDGYFGHEGKRESLTRLPEHAFAKLTRLRTLNLSYNHLETLPESFYALQHLESVDLRGTRLDAATVARVRSTFPNVRLDLRGVRLRDDVDDPNWHAVRAVVSTKAPPGHAEELAHFEQALARCTPGAAYSPFDELYALYRAIHALEQMLEQLPPSSQGRTELSDKIIRYATRALAMLPPPMVHVTDETDFEQQVVRRAGNALARVVLDRGEADRALVVIERALAVDPDDLAGYALATKARALLAAGREHEAFEVAYVIGADDPSASEVQAIKASPAFQQWQQRAGGAPS